MSSPRILVVSNLYPLPWEPNRATFNKQQFDRLGDIYPLQILVPVAWADYWKHRKQIKAHNTEHVRYICYWYTPKILYAWFSWFMYISLRLGARGWLRQKPDLIFASWAYPDGAASARWARDLNVPMILKVHGSDINVLADQGRRRQIIIETCSNADKVITVSRALKEKMHGFGVLDSRVTVVYNGVDKQLFYPEAVNPQEHYLLYVGNLKSDKGVLDLIEAYNRYRQNGGKQRLKVIGAGAEANRMQGMIAQYQLQDEIDMLGAMPHDRVAQYLRSADALVLPSYHEGVPNVLLESAACGIPVLATGVGGIPEIVLEGKTGILVEPGNIDQLANGMMQVTERSLWHSEDIVTHAQNYDWAKNIQQVRYTIDSVLGRHADKTKER